MNLSFLHRYLPTLIILCAILYLSLAPAPIPDADKLHLFKGADKVVHFCMYGGLILVFCFDLYRQDPFNKYRTQQTIIACISAILLGGGIELLQGYMGMGRSADWYDFAANSAGAIAGLLCSHYLIRRWLRKVKK
ncbi:MAG: VanZ family protein [Barnesiella sp.]